VFDWRRQEVRDRLKNLAEDGYMILAADRLQEALHDADVLRLHGFLVLSMYSADTMMQQVLRIDFGQDSFSTTELVSQKVTVDELEEVGEFAKTNQLITAVFASLFGVYFAPFEIFEVMVGNMDVCVNVHMLTFGAFCFSNYGLLVDPMRSCIGRFICLSVKCNQAVRPIQDKWELVESTESLNEDEGKTRLGRLIKEMDSDFVRAPFYDPANHNCNHVADRLFQALTT